MNLHEERLTILTMEKRDFDAKVKRVEEAFPNLCRAKEYLHRLKKKGIEYKILRVRHKK